MLKVLRKKEGFTLIELMIVVAIIGILAAIAIPAFVGYVRRSKTSEATGNLDSLYKGATSYYNNERTQAGLGAATSGHCTVVAVGPFPATVNDTKQKADFQSAAAGASYTDLGFSIADYIYYQYAVVGSTDMCTTPAGTAGLYTFQAMGDLDADGVSSTFDLACGSDANNELYHARGFNITNELE